MSHPRQKKWNSQTLKKGGMILGCILLVCAFSFLAHVFIISPSQAYKAGATLQEAGDYPAAVAQFIEAGRYKDSKARIDECYKKLYGVKAYEVLNEISVGSTFQFGAYEQDNDTANGKEPIEWIVLDKRDSSILLISRYGLDCQLYNTQYTSITWDSCSLRQWLNGPFISNAFSESEIDCIKDSIVFSDDNPDYATDSGETTQEKAFLLSVSECNKYFASDEDRICVPTAFALARNVYTEDNVPGCWWWLRTPGDMQHYASIVSGSGVVQTFGVNVCFDMCATRPALWLDLSLYYAE